MVELKVQDIQWIGLMKNLIYQRGLGNVFIEYNSDIIKLNIED